MARYLVFTEYITYSEILEMNRKDLASLQELLAAVGIKSEHNVSGNSNTLSVDYNGDKAEFREVLYGREKIRQMAW